MTLLYRHTALLLLALVLCVPTTAGASSTDGTIDPVLKYAWSDQVGWINFAASASTIHVTDSGLDGYAWSNNYGWINLRPVHGGVTNNGEGVLGGFAWGASLGWVDFSGVTIDVSGDFSGAATGPLVGTLTFDCTHCAVATDWRPASSRPPDPPTPSEDGAKNRPGVSSMIESLNPGFPPTGGVAAPDAKGLPARSDADKEDAYANVASVAAAGLAAQQMAQDVFDALPPWARTFIILAFCAAVLWIVVAWWRRRKRVDPQL